MDSTRTSALGPSEKKVTGIVCLSERSRLSAFHPALINPGTEQDGLHGTALELLSLPRKATILVAMCISGPVAKYFTERERVAIE